MPVPEVLVFISHASEDASLALRLVDLPRASLNLPSSAIRGTTVDGTLPQPQPRAPREARGTVGSQLHRGWHGRCLRHLRQNLCPNAVDGQRVDLTQ